MFKITDTDVNLVIVDVRRNCEVWVQTLTDEELKTQFAGKRTIAFGVGRDKLSNNYPQVPLHSYRTFGKCLLIDSTKNVVWEVLDDIPYSFKIILPLGCQLSINVL